MNREKLVEIAYQRGKELNLKNKNYLGWLRNFFDQEYREDIGSGDVTSEAVITKNKLGRAVLKAKQSGVVAGVEETTWFYQQHGVNVIIHVQDGQDIRGGQIILEVMGKQKNILATERIGLNVLQRMSGIATETKSLTDQLKDYKTRVAATRKTQLRYLDKKAVFVGGGLTHRLGLWDSILIKDNHLEALKNEGLTNPIEKAIALASRFVNKANFVEVETTNHDDALRAARKFKQLKLNKPCIIMFDNMYPEEIASIVEKLRSENLYDHVLLEASGNITRGNMKEYAKTGVDVVSLGYLTHSVRIFDMSLEMTK